MSVPGAAVMALQQVVGGMPSADATLRALLNAAADPHAAASSSETIDTTTAHAAASHGCFPHIRHGSETEHSMAVALQWLTVVISILQLGFFAWHRYKSTTGWEEVYVCIIELIKVLVEIWHEWDSPAFIMQTNGNYIAWLRYAEWLLTCPVILIHVSNLTGLKDQYSKRTMTLLVTDIGTIVWGVTAALTKGRITLLFFFLALTYGSVQFFNIAKVYIESFHMLPKGICRRICKLLAYIFFSSWLMFPVLFIAGPEGLGVLSPYGSGIAHLVLDLVSKNLWCLMAHTLRVKIHRHILVHGDIRKKTKINIAGEEMEVEAFVDGEEEGGVRHDTADMVGRRASLQRMADRMRAEGQPIRASIEGTRPQDVDEDHAAHKFTHKLASPAANPAIQPGRIILIVPDGSMIDYFHSQIAQLSPSMELVPAVGQDLGLQVVAQASMMGGADLVLVHPEFLTDRTPNGLLARLKGAGHRVCAFGWTPISPTREFIETSGVDGWLEGPTFGAGISQAQLAALVARMQAMRLQGNLIGTSLHPSVLAHSMPAAQQATQYGVGTGSPGFASAANTPTHMYSNVLHLQDPSPRKLSPAPSTDNAAGLSLRNNLSYIPMQPLQQQQQQQPPTATTPQAYSTSPTQGPSSQAGSAGAREADMLQVLMSEISRLKSELGESSV